MQLKPFFRDLTDKLPEKWKTILVLGLVLISVIFGFYFIWGLLLLYWGWRGIQSGESYLVEPVQRRSHPVLYWLITALWIVFGLFYIYIDPHLRSLVGMPIFNGI